MVGALALTSSLNSGHWVVAGLGAVAGCWMAPGQPPCGPHRPVNRRRLAPVPVRSGQSKRRPRLDRHGDGMSSDDRHAWNGSGWAGLVTSCPSDHLSFGPPLVISRDSSPVCLPATAVRRRGWSAISCGSSRQLQPGCGSSRQLQPGCDSSRQLLLGCGSSRQLLLGCGSSGQLLLGCGSFGQLRLQRHVVPVGPTLDGLGGRPDGL